MTIDSDLGRLGVSLSRLLRAVAVLDGWIDAGIVGAVSAVIMRRGFVVRTYARGHYGPGNSGLNIDSNSLFHLASIGKPMAACAVMILVEEGRLSLDEPVATWIEEFRRPECVGITVRHLLSHTSGLPQDPDLKGLPRGIATAAEIETYRRAVPVVPTGSKVEYSNVAYGLLGIIIQAVSGFSFADFMRTRVFTPLGMRSTMIAPEGSLTTRIVHVAGTRDPGDPFERFNSSYARTLTHPAGVAVGTALDTARFFQLFLDHGRLPHGGRLLAPATVQAMLTNQTAGLRGGIEGFTTWPDCAWGLGFDLRGQKRPHFSGDFSDATTFGHTGVAGTFAWADPTRELVCVMLANQMLYNGWFAPHWARFSNAVVASLDG